MAKAHYNMPIENMTGEWAPGCVCRQKRFRVGNKLLFGPKEIYHKNKRDYHQKPFRSGEQQNCELFRRAEALRKQEMQNPERSAYWEARFAAQADRPEAGSTKVYCKKDAFVRAMLMRQLRKEPDRSCATGENGC